jgi:hypothetical protein
MGRASRSTTSWQRARRKRVRLITSVTERVQALRELYNYNPHDGDTSGPLPRALRGVSAPGDRVARRFSEPSFLALSCQPIQVAELFLVQAFSNHTPYPTHQTHGNHAPHPTHLNFAIRPLPPTSPSPNPPTTRSAGTLSRPPRATSTATVAICLQGKGQGQARANPFPGPGGQARAKDIVCIGSLEKETARDRLGTD